MLEQVGTLIDIDQAKLGRRILTYSVIFVQWHCPCTVLVLKGPDIFLHLGIQKGQKATSFAVEGLL